jgi:hypothetical protein
MNIQLIKILSIIVYFDAFMWIVGVIPTLYYALSNGRLPILAGIPLLAGPFEKLGLNNLIVAGIGYVMVSALKILAAYWLSASRMDGAVLEVILLGLSAIFWYGFALPLGPVFGVVQVVLLALTWNALV